MTVAMALSQTDRNNATVEMDAFLFKFSEGTRKGMPESHPFRSPSCCASSLVVYGVVNATVAVGTPERPLGSPCVTVSKSTATASIPDVTVCDSGVTVSGGAVSEVSAARRV